jgi:hypothetical protein
VAIKTTKKKESAIKEANIYFVLPESQSPRQSRIKMLILAYVIVPAM